jgi:hypothetical protein
MVTKNSLASDFMTSAMRGGFERACDAPPDEGVSCGALQPEPSTATARVTTIATVDVPVW